MRFNFVVHDPDALFNIIHQQRRDQAVIEANDAARRQTATRRGAMSVAGAGTKLQSNATCLLYTSPSPRDKRQSRMPSSA